MAGFDLLTYVIQLVAGMEAEEFYRKELFQPLEMRDTGFCLDHEQKQRLARLYKRKRNRLVDVTETKDDMDGILRRSTGYIAGCGGLFSTVDDYEYFARMLCQEGSFDGKQVLNPETV